MATGCCLLPSEESSTCDIHPTQAETARFRVQGHRLWTDRHHAQLGAADIESRYGSERTQRPTGWDSMASQTRAAFRGTTTACHHRRQRVQLNPCGFDVHPRPQYAIYWRRENSNKDLSHQRVEEALSGGEGGSLRPTSHD